MPDRFNISTLNPVPMTTGLCVAVVSDGPARAPRVGALSFAIQ